MIQSLARRCVWSVVRWFPVATVLLAAIAEATAQAESVADKGKLVLDASAGARFSFGGVPWRVRRQAYGAVLSNALGGHASARDISGV